MQLIDSHCHLDFEDFAHDREAVIDRASKVGVNHIIIPAVAHDSWQRTTAICKKFPQCHLALGLHPIFIDQHQPQHLSELDNAISQQRPIAIGEIGLDFYDKKHSANREKQIAFFTKQIVIANHHALPVIIHNRKAHDQCLQTLQEQPGKGGIIHAFNGSLQQAEKYIELNFLLGFGGMLTYSRSKKLQHLAKHIPIEHIVLETDAPDMTVQQHYGQRNSPEYLHYVVESLSEIKGISQTEIAAVTTANVKSLFALH